MQTYLPVVLIVLTAAAAAVDGQTTLRIATDETDLVLQTDREGRLCQTYFGEKLLHATDLSELTPLTKKGYEAYATEDGRNFFEPALGVTHSDGSPSARLRYVYSHRRGHANRRCAARRGLPAGRGAPLRGL